VTDGLRGFPPQASRQTEREKKKSRVSVFALEMKPCLRKNTGHDQASLMMEEQGEEKSDLGL
jgi:hypothetical protein